MRYRIPTGSILRPHGAKDERQYRPGDEKALVKDLTKEQITGLVERGHVLDLGEAAASTSEPKAPAAPAATPAPTSSPASTSTAKTATPGKAKA